MTATEEPQLPDGTVTFLFSDVERSTQIVGELGNERYADVLGSHRRLLREAFAANRGHEVGTEGDAFFVAFARAEDAVAAAVAGQRALLSHELRVRIGLHTGEALVRDRDYVGHDVHRAKRVCDAGHGGQILLSATTAELVGATTTLTDLGPHRLKDLEEAQRIFQVVIEGLRADFPALRSLDHFTNNLPAQRSSFVGRERELAEVSGLLEQHRLVTLTGIGGCGKTRLALQVGAELVEAHPGGVFFVDLAPISAEDAFIPAVSNAVGLILDAQSGAAGSPEALLLNYLTGRNCILILDNCEHLLDVCAGFADAVLGSCPQVRLLNTSREGLAVQGEQLWQVPSLSLPDDTQDAGASEAVSLFVNRAVAVRPAFALTPQNLPYVNEICRRLDGIPLAIEFAAARTSHLPPKEIAERLKDSFLLLTGGRGRVQRQQTLQATLDWSFALLSETERALLRRLSVFAGSFNLRAAEAVCADNELAAGEIVDLLGSLVAKSLVVVNDTDDEARYRLLETVRLYAADQLRAADETHRVRTRHLEWIQALVETVEWAASLVVASTAANPFRADVANIRAALEFAESEERFDLVLLIAARVGNLWASTGLMREGFGWLTRTRPEDVEVSPEAGSAALSTAASIAGFLQDGSGFDLAARAVAVAGDKPSVVMVKAYGQRAFSLAIRSQWANDDDLAAAARADLVRAGELASEFTPQARFYVVEVTAAIELILGDADRALAAAVAAIAVDPDELNTFGLLATAAHITGDHDRALDAARRYLEFARSGSFPRSDVRWLAGTSRGGAPTAVGLFASIVALAGGGQIREARALLDEHLALPRLVEQPALIEQFIVAYAALAYIDGDYEGCSQLLSWVRARTFTAGRTIPSSPAYAIYRHYVGLIRGKLDADVGRRCREAGQAMTEDEVIAYVTAGQTQGGD